MPKTLLRICALFLIVLGPGAGRALAQVPADSLGGKTVHVFLASQAFDGMLIENVNTRMKQDARYWYSYTFTNAGLFDYTDGFYFSNPNHDLFFSKSGMGATEGMRFMLSDFQGSKEIWIIEDPTGPSTAKPVILAKAPRIIDILNPWPASVPKLVSGSKSFGMTAIYGRCGWFSALLLDSTLKSGHFAEVGSGGTYGKSGYGTSDDFDFEALSAGYGSESWLNTSANTWSAAYPNVEGVCRYALSMTIRDFSKSHPDFDFVSLSGEHYLKGAVNPLLGPDPGRKPLLNPTAAAKDPAISYRYFDSWWVTDSANADSALRSYESCYDLPMGKSLDGQWQYDSYYDSPDHGFWPAEWDSERFPSETVNSCYAKPPPQGSTWVTGTAKRNGNFCAESHADFVYAPGQRFSFRGDDDVWMFIDGKLVMDLGGVHTPQSDSLDLDKLGLIPGKTYKWDFFYCDRQPCGSALRITTSIAFRQQRSLFGVPRPGPTPGALTVEIWKRAGGNGSCGSAAEKTDSAKATRLAYRLLDAGDKVVKDLAAGSGIYGGITLGDAEITVDTANLVPGGDLVRGAAYRVIAFEPSNPSVRVEVGFRVPGAPDALRPARVPAVRSRPWMRYRNVLGRRIPDHPGP